MNYYKKVHTALFQAVEKPEFLRCCLGQEPLRMSVYATASRFQHASNFELLGNPTSC
jgi:hypothetical protein